MATFIGTKMGDTITPSLVSGGVASAPGGAIPSGANDEIFGLQGNDTLNGGGGDDILHGGDNNDTLFGSEGNDTLYGGEGDDHFRGGVGVDELTGGLGLDTFDYNFINESLPGAHDHITDFTSGGGKAPGGDVINLSDISAFGAGAGGTFTWIGPSPFTPGVFGELRYDPKVGLLQGNTDGSGAATFEIHLQNNPNLFVGGAFTDVIL